MAAAGQGAVTLGGGTITLTAGGSDKQIDVQNVVTATTGAITLTADGTLTTGGSGVISGSGGVVRTSMDANARVSTFANLNTYTGPTSILTAASAVGTSRGTMIR